MGSQALAAFTTLTQDPPLSQSIASASAFTTFVWRTRLSTTLAPGYWQVRAQQEPVCTAHSRHPGRRQVILHRCPGWHLAVHSIDIITEAVLVQRAD